MKKTIVSSCAVLLCLAILMSSMLIASAKSSDVQYKYTSKGFLCGQSIGVRSQVAEVDTWVELTCARVISKMDVYNYSTAAMLYPTMQHTSYNWMNDECVRRPVADVQLSVYGTSEWREGNYAEAVYSAVGNCGYN